MKKKSRIRRKNLIKIVTAAEAVTALCIVGCSGKFIFSMVSNINEIPQISAVHSDELLLDASQPDEENSAPCTYIQKNKTDAFDGQLVLVNNNHGYRFADNTDALIPAHEIKNSSYSLIDHSVILKEETILALNSLFEDFEAQAENFDELYEIIIQSGYRSVAKQSVIYNDDLAANGTHTSSRAAKPGSSEHHTGYAVDFKVVTDDKKISVLENSGIFSWIYENSYKYGLVQRYTEDKAYLTDVLARSYHFRYVGIPHAYYMHENNLCLEEYIDLLENYEFDKKHLEINTDTYAYEVYYIRAETEGDTKVYVPKNSEYSISGNNIDGFIVTVLKGTATAEPVSSDNTAFTEVPSSEMPDIMTGTEVS